MKIFSRACLLLAMAVGLAALHAGCGGHSDGIGAAQQNIPETEVQTDEPFALDSSSASQALAVMTKDVVNAALGLNAPSLNLSKALPPTISERCADGIVGTYTCPGGGQVGVSVDACVVSPAGTDCAVILDPLQLSFQSCVDNDGVIFAGDLVTSSTTILMDCSADAVPLIELDAVSADGVTASYDGASFSVREFVLTIDPDAGTVDLSSRIGSDAGAEGCALVDGEMQCTAGDPGNLEQHVCQTNADCHFPDAALICFQGKCYPPCSSDADCQLVGMSECFVDPEGSFWTREGIQGLDDAGTCAALTDESLACADGADNDGDGKVDCADEECFHPVNCSPESVCGDGMDNDVDGAADCADADCLGKGVCENPEATCDDGMDNDADTKVDCADPDCAGKGICETPEATCNDTVDNDADGDVDCADDDCAAAPICEDPEQSCDDGFDNDGDGAIDCADHPHCDWYAPCGGMEGDCFNGVDEDEDGATDCADRPDCDSYWRCEHPEVSCDDTYGITPVDNDGDGLANCDDPDCAASPACAHGEICNNLIDDDGDSEVDCADHIDCMNQGAGHYCQWYEDSAPSGCEDSFDNDGDGLIDCADNDCVGDPACPEICDDGIDNDGDYIVDCGDLDCFDDPICNESLCGTGDCCSNGINDDPHDDSHVDCDDNDCHSDPACIPEVCDDETDNDGDGDIDCADDECTSDPGCEYPEATCDDVFDNDGDGGVDCADADCALDPFCTGGEICDNWKDDDDDGLVDCDDPDDCSGNPLCPPSSERCTADQGTETCDDDPLTYDEAQTAWTNMFPGDDDCDTFGASDCCEALYGIGSGRTCVSGCCVRGEICDDFGQADEDNDGDSNCDDSDCAHLASCGGSEANCGDGLDNDVDSLTDCDDLDDCCADAACSAAPQCQVETNCNDNVDDDGDEAIDCMDSDCTSDAACQHSCQNSTSCAIAEDYFLTNEATPVFDECSDLTGNCCTLYEGYGLFDCVSDCCEPVNECDWYDSCALAQDYCEIYADDGWCDDPANYGGDWCSAYWWDPNYACDGTCCVYN